MERNIVGYGGYEMTDIRYYMGRHKIKVLKQMDWDRKVYVEHLEDGFIGNKKVGRKAVFKGEMDILYWRCCWRNKK